MTTFTSEDREKAYDPGLSCVTPSSATGLEVDLVAEAPYHPGYEDAVRAPKDDFTVVNTNEYNKMLQELNEWRQYKERHLTTAGKIANFVMSKNEHPTSSR